MNTMFIFKVKIDCEDYKIHITKSFLNLSDATNYLIDKYLTCYGIDFSDDLKVLEFSSNVYLNHYIEGFGKVEREIVHADYSDRDYHIKNPYEEKE